MTTAAKESALEIRTPRTGDRSRMAELAGQLGYKATGADIEKRLAEMESSPDYAVFVAALPSGEIAGWVGVFVYRCVEADTRAEINGLVVDERMRSLGIGRRLVERAEEWARQKGCEMVGVRSNVIRERAHGFYERLGYEHFKTQKSFRKDL
jgi:GNAT superfamily N-acetyltransferase